MNAIQIQNLTKAFKAPPFSSESQHLALNNVNLEVKKGTICALLGPNGAGKTTLIRILSGLIPFTTGKIEINGMPFQQTMVRKMGVLLSDQTGLWEFMTGLQNLEYFCALQNIVGESAKKKIEELIELFEMTSFITRQVRTYSKGTKQKLLLARTMLHDPEILLLDEPVAHLDPMATREFHALLRDRLNRSLKKTILLATHQLEEAQEISDVLAFLFQGNLIWQKSADSFRSKQTSLLNEYIQTVENISSL